MTDRMYLTVRCNWCGSVVATLAAGYTGTRWLCATNASFYRASCFDAAQAWETRQAVLV